MSLVEDHRPSYRWSFKGRTPIVKFNRNKENSVVFYGGLSYQTKKEIAHLGENKRSEEFIVWLERVVAAYQDQINQLLPDHLEYLKTTDKYKGLILIILDGATNHTSNEIKEWLKNHYGIIELFRFPTYSPDINPQEKVWKATRKHLDEVEGRYSFKQTVDRACHYLTTKTFNYKFV